MPIMYGFSQQRRALLEAEAQRFAVEAPPYGALRAYVVGSYAVSRVEPDTELELVVVQDTDEPFHRRPDFWVSHMRPQVGTRFLVYTPEEFEELENIDPFLIGALSRGELLIG